MEFHISELPTWTGKANVPLLSEKERLSSEQEARIARLKAEQLRWWFEFGLAGPNDNSDPL